MMPQFKEGMTWRERASMARASADVVLDPYTIRTLLLVATTYDRLANREDAELLNEKRTHA